VAMGLTHQSKLIDGSPANFCRKSIAGGILPLSTTEPISNLKCGKLVSQG
jgi:hypothetical protein